MLFKANSVVPLFHCLTGFTVSLFQSSVYSASSVLLYKLYKVLYPSLHLHCIILCISTVLFTQSVLLYLMHQYWIIHFISAALFNMTSLHHSLYQYFCSGILLVFIWIAILIDNIYLKHHYVSRLWHNEMKVGSFVSFPTLAQ